MKKYSVVVIGCGYIGRQHLEDIYFRDNIRVAGVVDVNEAIAKETAILYKAESYDTDYINYLKRDDIDIVIIATYTKTHLAILRDCVKYGKHVLCEKPLASTVEEVNEFERLATESNVKVTIGLILRHNKSYHAIYEMIKNDMIGHPIVFRLAQNQHALNWNRFLQLLNDTPPLVDCGIHYFDLMEWFTGSEVVAINGMKGQADYLPEGQHNYNIATAKLADGSVGYYEVIWSKSATVDTLKEFVGPKGHIKLVYKEHRFTHHEMGDLIEYYNCETKEYKEINIEAKYKPMYEQLEHLINAIENDMSTDDEVKHACHINRMLIEACNAHPDYIYYRSPNLNEDK